MSTDVETAIEQVLAGRLEAYAEIVRAYQDEVWRIVAFALRSPAATEDLVQQAFVAAYESLDRFEPGRDFGVWLRSIARNLVKNELRRRSRENERLRRYREHVLRTFEDPGEADEREARLRAALARCRERLGPASHEALELRYACALPFEEVARRLGRTVAATRQLLQRTRTTLRACIEERGIARS